MRSFEELHAWRSALIATILNVVGVPIELFVGRSVPGMPHWPAFLSMAVGAFLAVLLLLRRKNASVRFCSAVFVANAFIVSLGIWVLSGVYAASEPGWIPLQENKLGALVVALLAPGLLPGLISITLHIGSALARLSVFPRALPNGEPVATILFGVVGIVLLIVRLRGLALQRRLLASAADERLARTFLALRDLANSPLQTIELTSAILRARDPHHVHEVDRIDRALTKLRRMNTLLSAHDEHAAWVPNTETFDAISEVRSELEALAKKDAR